MYLCIYQDPVHGPHSTRSLRSVN